MSSILVLHGPNLNLLGVREPHLYGHETLEDINHRLASTATRRDHRLSSFQSNAEHELIECIHDAMGSTDYIIINPAAFTHTSVALRDALAGVSIPFIEVHISNVHQREPFRHQSYFSDLATGVICGLGSYGYDCALAFVMRELEHQPSR